MAIPVGKEAHWQLWSQFFGRKRWVQKIGSYHKVCYHDLFTYVHFSSVQVQIDLYLNQGFLLLELTALLKEPQTLEIGYLELYQFLLSPFQQIMHKDKCTEIRIYW